MQQRSVERLSGMWLLWRPRLIHAVQIIFFILPFAVFSAFVCRNAVDVPIYDDFDALVDFVGRFIQSPDVVARAKLLFAQYNEHRIVFSRLSALADYYLFHHIDLSHLTIWGGAGWVLAVLALVLVVKRWYALPLVSVLPIPYIMLAFVQNEPMHFASAGLVEYWVILFCILFAACLANNRTAWAGLIIPAALFTHGGGIVLFPLMALFLFLRRKWKALLVFLGGAAVLAVIYFHHWQAAPGIPSITENLANSEMIIPWFFAFLGNATGTLQAALPIGLLTFAVLIAILVLRTDDHLLSLLTSYVLLVATTTSLTRSGMGQDMAIRSGYAMYSLLGWACIYLFGINSIKNPITMRKTVLAGQVLAMAFFAAFFLKWQLPDALANWNAVEVNGLVRFATGDTSGLLFYDKAKAGRILVDAQRSGVYDYQKNIRAVVSARTTADFPASGGVQGSIDEQKGAYIAGWALQPNVDAGQSQVSMLLSSESQAYQISTFKTKRVDVAQSLKNTLYTDAGFQVAIPLAQLPSGSYKIGLVVQHGDVSAVKWTDKLISVP